ncbi:apolipoprotein N-acyltransferase [Noviherbaspirillum sp. UKPF54]|uniref:apolipoprotein N-acyltransferase n=1 Tax=Noviherbaspirillum sp. UKPF54 TaxID=2601898 RepID=UPI0011B17FFA|nr:apolipoprotein N-acyltransferase [Noviherbaspirillum sp. UKPF54]
MLRRSVPWTDDFPASDVLREHARQWRSSALAQKYPVKKSSLPAPTSSLYLLAALIAGALNVFAFAPFGLWPLQILGLAFAFRLALAQGSAWRGALVGWAYGFGWLAAGTHWLYISMHRYGGMPGWMAALAVAALALLLSALAAMALGSAAWLKRRWSLGAGAALLLVFPPLWALAEWTRGWIFTGFPWVSSGYAHSMGPLAGFAPVLGVYGLALIAGIIAGCLALLPAKRLPVLLAAALCVTGLGLKSVSWTIPHGQPISVRLLQGNVPQEMKFAPEHIEATLALYYDMITTQRADLISTPETAIPLLSSQLPPDYLGKLKEFARTSDSHIALGIPVMDGPMQYANSMIGLSPSAAAPYRYDKHHLVPFGEFIPLGARWFVDMMHIPLGDFTRGALLQAPFAVRDQRILPNICYEDLFGEEIAAQLRAGQAEKIPQATILLNLSNIAWFGDSIALPQHLQISQMRALETGRPMLRATNTGATAVIDARGQIVARLQPFERGILSANVQGYDGLTPYCLYGNTLTVILCIALLATAWAMYRSRRNNPHNPHKNR